MNDVVVVGSANADLVVTVPRRPGGGETLLGSDLETFPGGKGANQAAAAGRSGAATAFVGCMGDDAHGAFLRDKLSEAGVDVSAVETVEQPTGTAIIFLTPDGENSIVVAPGANYAVTIERAQRSEAVWTAAKVAVFSLEIPLDTVDYVARHAADAGVRIVFNAAPSAKIAPETLRLCDPLIVNEHEAQEVLGAPDGTSFEDLATGLLEAGARSVVITLGAEGALVLDGDGLDAIPAYRVTAVDTTGAGDAFVGALAGELAGGAALRDAVRFATAVSAVAVQRIGAQSSYADRAEVEAFIRDRGAL